MSTTAEEIKQTTAIVEQPAYDPLAEVKAKLTDHDKEDFFKSFISDKPYQSTETLFDGKMVVKFTSLTITQNNSIMRQMEYDRRTKRAQDNDAYFIRMIQYRVAACLLEIDGVPFAPDIPSATPDDTTNLETYISKRVELMRDWPVYKISSLTDAFNRFEKKLLALTQESFKQNF